MGVGCRCLRLFNPVCLTAFAIMLVVAGWQDLRTLRIANPPVAGDGRKPSPLWAAAGVALGRMSAATLGVGRSFAAWSCSQSARRACCRHRGGR